MSALRAYLSNRRPPRANPAESDDAFAERVLRGALTPPFDERRVWEVAESIKPPGAERGGKPKRYDEWLDAVGEHMETLAGRGLVPADLPGRFPFLAPDLRLWSGAVMAPWYGAAVLAAWMPRMAAVTEAVGEFHRVRGAWLDAHREAEEPSELTLTTEGAAWWEDRYSRWVLDHPAQVAGGLCWMSNKLALEALEDFDRAGFPRPALHPTSPSPVLERAWSAVDRLIVAPALVWRALVASGREAPRDVAKRFQAGWGRGRRRVTWADVPAPFGPLAEIVAQGLVPMMASFGVPRVTLGLLLA